jgi:hypothetical protein
MFVKRVEKAMLEENFEEVKNVEKEMLSLGSNPGVEGNKVVGKKPLLLTNTTRERTNYLDNVLKLVKKLCNEVVDLKKNIGEGSSHHKPFKPFHRK